MISKMNKKVNKNKKEYIIFYKNVFPKIKPSGIGASKKIGIITKKTIFVLFKNFIN